MSMMPNPGIGAMRLSSGMRPDQRYNMMYPGQGKMFGGNSAVNSGGGYGAGARSAAPMSGGGGDWGALTPRQSEGAAINTENFAQQNQGAARLKAQREAESQFGLAPGTGDNDPRVQKYLSGQTSPSGILPTPGPMGPPTGGTPPVGYSAPPASMTPNQQALQGANQMAESAGYARRNMLPLNMWRGQSAEAAQQEEMARRMAATTPGMVQAQGIANTGAQIANTGAQQTVEQRGQAFPGQLTTQRLGNEALATRNQQIAPDAAAERDVQAARAAGKIVTPEMAKQQQADKALAERQGFTTDMKKYSTAVQDETKQYAAKMKELTGRGGGALGTGSDAANQAAIEAEHQRHMQAMEKINGMRPQTGQTQVGEPAPGPGATGPGQPSAPIAAAQPEQTMVNPQTGHRIALRGGRWVDAATNQPIQ